MQLNNTIESKLNGLSKDVNYAVGWSGGIDSTALLLSMKKSGFNVKAWHIDHAWREENKDEDNALLSICDSIGVELISERLEHARSHKNKEAIARKARYAQFSEWSEMYNIDHICLGHHKEDQAETVYMRLLKGAGIRGCSGISFANTMYELRILRPFLELNKDTLKEYLEKNNVHWIEDPSNKNNDILRNRIRNNVFPYMYDKKLDPIELFVSIGKISKEAEKIANKLLEDYSFETIGSTAVKFKWKDWQEMSGEIKKLFLQKMGKELFDPSFSFGKRHLNYAQEWKGFGSIDLTKTKLERKKKDMILSRKI